MKYWPAIALGRLVRFAIRRVRPGGGSALPGLVVSKLAPGLLAKTLSSFPGGLIVITGSAGKSTTTKMAVGILRAHGVEVFTNPSTANIAQGFYSTIIEQSNLSGRINGDVAVLEMDEGHAAEITRLIDPKIVTLLNVLDDQLDRFVDPSIVRSKLAEVANRAVSHLVINSDDQNLLLLSRDLKLKHQPTVRYIDISDAAKNGSKNALGYAETYLDEIAKPVSDARVSAFSGKNCEIEIAGETVKVSLASRGLHFALDAMAALETSGAFLGSRFSLSLAVETLNAMPPVFARGEIVEIEGQKVEFILVQNPTSFQLNIDSLDGTPECLMVAIGRDVHDPSWLWTVDYSSLNSVDIVSGYNAAEMALCFAYNEINVEMLEPELRSAFDAFLALPQPTSGVKTVIFSADAMRRSRRMLGFTSPDEVDR